MTTLKEGSAAFFAINLILKTRLTGNGGQFMNGTWNSITSIC